MRVSFRKAVKLAAILVVLLLGNLFIEYKLSEESDSESEKLLGHLTRDNGEPLESGSRLHASVGPKGQSRQQRSAKSVQRPYLITKLVPGLHKTKNLTSGVFKPKLSTELAESQALSHGRPTALADIFISVKTSGKFHASRLQLILQTWYRLARDQVSFFSLNYFS